MERLFVRKNQKLYAGSEPCFYLVCLALFCGTIWFAVIRDSAANYIASLAFSLGIEPVFTSATLCLLLLAALYFGMTSAAALVTVPCICIVSGFAVEAASYAYGGVAFTDPDFLIFALLIFAYILSALFAATYAVKLSKSIQSFLRSNRSLKTELIRYQIIFVLIVILLIVSGYFVLT